MRSGEKTTRQADAPTCISPPCKAEKARLSLSLSLSFSLSLFLFLSLSLHLPLLLSFLAVALASIREIETLLLHRGRAAAAVWKGEIIKGVEKEEGGKEEEEEGELLLASLIFSAQAKVGKYIAVVLFLNKSKRLNSFI